MGHGEGSVYQRADGKWVAAMMAGWTERGTRRRVTRTCATERQAKTALRDMRREWLASSQTAIDPRTTVKRYADHWLDDYATRARPRTVTTARGAVAHWIVPTIGQRRLSELTAGDMARVTAAVTDAGRAPTTAVNVRSVLHTMLRDARREGHAVPDAALDARMPSPGVNPRQAYPVADAVKILATAAAGPEHWPPLDTTGMTPQEAKFAREARTAAEETDPSRWVAAFLQGMRQAECLGLTWECVDLDRGTVDVSWQLQVIPTTATPPANYEVRRLVGSYCLTRPKTRAGRRTMPLVPWMVDALRAWRDECPPTPWGLVWPTASGAPRKRQVDTRAFQHLVDIAGVPPKDNGSAWVLHEARHTTVSVLTALEVPVPVILAIVGHASMASTQRYTHVDMAAARGALERVADQLGLTGEGRALTQ